MDLKDVVQEYIESGRKYGFAFAECIVAKYTPNGILVPKCYNVPVDKREELVKDLREGPGTLRPGSRR